MQVPVRVDVGQVRARDAQGEFVTRGAHECAIDAAPIGCPFSSTTKTVCKRFGRHP